MSFDDTSNSKEMDDSPRGELGDILPGLCPVCGGSDLEFDDSQGQSICTSCGVVCSENETVSTLVGGPTPVLQSGLSALGRSAASLSRFASQDRTSRESTLMDWRIEVERQAGALGLGKSLVDSGVRLSRLAVENGFTRGRRVRTVAAACLYAACRRERTPHLLLDFSDKLQCNMFVLGMAFTSLVKSLHLSVPLVDPSLYMHRFAAELDLGPVRHQVAETALRFLQAMERDWMVTGRSPAGVCGACLISAARLHGVPRSTQQVVRVVRADRGTVRERLQDIKETEADGLGPAGSSAPPRKALDPPSLRRGLAAAEAASEEPPSEAAVEGEIRSILGREDIVRGWESSSAGLSGPLRAESAEVCTLEPELVEALAAPLADEDDDEVAECVLDAETIRFRTRAWEEMHGAFVEEQRLKKQKREDEGKPRPRKKRKRNDDPLAAVVASSAARAAVDALRKTTISRHIGEKQMRAILGEDGPLPSRPPASSSSSSAGAVGGAAAAAAAAAATQKKQVGTDDKDDGGTSDDDGRSTSSSSSGFGGGGSSGDEFEMGPAAQLRRQRGRAMDDFDGDG